MISQWTWLYQALSEVSMNIASNILCWLIRCCYMRSCVLESDFHLQNWPVYQQQSKHFIEPERTNSQTIRCIHWALDCNLWENFRTTNTTKTQGRLGEPKHGLGGHLHHLFTQYKHWRRKIRVAIVSYALWWVTEWLFLIPVFQRNEDCPVN